MTDIITHTMDYKTTEHWCNAVTPSVPAAFPSTVFDHGNVLQFAIAQDIWFTPDVDAAGNVIDNSRLEEFRLACLYDATSNLLDIGVNLDDEIAPTVEWIRLLTQHAGTGEPSNLLWMTYPTDSSIILRTLRMP